MPDIATGLAAIVYQFFLVVQTSTPRFEAGFPKLFNGDDRRFPAYNGALPMVGKPPTQQTGGMVTWSMPAVPAGRLEIWEDVDSFLDLDSDG